MPILNAHKITVLRVQRGWSQRRLAAEAGVSSAVVTRLEKAQQHDFKISIVAAIANALEVPIDSLLSYPQEKLLPELAPELQAVLLIVAQQPEPTQQHIAGIIRGYLDVAT